MQIYFITEPDETGKGRVVVDGRYYGLPMSAVLEYKRQNDALATLAKYFTSGNRIPVDQATIKATDFWSITGMEVPNVELTGAARLYRAASSDRRERG